MNALPTRPPASGCADCGGRARAGIITLMGTPPFIEVANIGMADSLILMILALVVFGPRRLPQIGRQIGKLMYEFRKASNDFKFQMEEELRNAEEADRRRREEAERQRTLALAPPEQAAETSSQVTEDGYGASSETEGASTEDSYPYATEYAEVPTPEDEEAAPEAQAEESYLRIQPPSTGETVAAERPGSAVAATETVEAGEQPASTEAVSDSAGVPVSEAASGAVLEPDAAPAKAAAPAAKRTRRKKKEAVVEQTNAATEPATHNG